MARLQNLKLLIIEPLNLKEMVCSAKEFLDLQRTGNVIAESIKEFVTKVLFVNDAELKLQIQK